jgi:hypothetical protein
VWQELLPSMCVWGAARVIVRYVLSVCAMSEVVVCCCSTNVNIGGCKPCASGVVGEEQKFLLRNVEMALLE